MLGSKRQKKLPQHSLLRRALPLNSDAIFTRLERDAFLCMNILGLCICIRNHESTWTWIKSVLKREKNLRDPYNIDIQCAHLQLLLHTPSSHWWSASAERWQIQHRHSLYDRGGDLIHFIIHTQSSDKSHDTLFTERGGNSLFQPTQF